MLNAKETNKEIVLWTVVVPIALVVFVGSIILTLFDTKNSSKQHGRQYQSAQYQARNP